MFVGNDMIVYKATNKINGKIYIGITKHSLESRISRHLNSTYRTGSKARFHRAIRKWGFESFDWEIIDTVDNYEILKEKERYQIKFFKSKIPNGYNLTDGGDSKAFGYHHTAEAKRKIGEHNYQKTLEGKERLRKQMLGNNNPSKRPEVREKIRLSKLGDKNAQFGKPAWNTGLTKETDGRLKAISIKVSKTLTGRPSGRKGKHYYNGKYV